MILTLSGLPGGRLGGLLGRLGGLLRSVWPVLGHLEAIWAVLGASWSHLSRLGGHLGRLGGNLRAALEGTPTTREVYGSLRVGETDGVYLLWVLLGPSMWQAGWAETPLGN